MCHVFVSINQLNLAASDGSLHLTISNRFVRVADRLALLCQKCQHEIVFRQVDFSFQVPHEVGPGHDLVGLPVSRSPVFEVVGGKRYYGAIVVCRLICTCSWSASVAVKIGDLASNFSSFYGS
jgi:hypothetical protein